MSIPISAASRLPATTCHARVPPGDDAVAADQLINGSLECVATAIRDLACLIDVHRDIAPTIAVLVKELSARLAGEALAWVTSWPQ